MALVSKLVALLAVALSLHLGLCHGARLPELQDRSVELETAGDSKSSILSADDISLCGEVGGAFDGWGYRFSEYPANHTYVTRIIGWSGNWYAHWVVWGLGLTYSDGRYVMVGSRSTNLDECDLGREPIKGASIYYWNGKDILGIRFHTANGQCDLGAAGAGDAQVKDCTPEELGSGRLHGIQGRVGAPFYRLGLGFLKKQGEED